MIKPINIIGILVLSISAFGLFQVKYYVQNLRQQLTELNHQIEQEQEAIHVLSAEWAYLNQSERLKQLTEQYLHLKPIHLSQIQNMESDLPNFHFVPRTETRTEIANVVPKVGQHIRDDELLQEVKELMGEMHDDGGRVMQVGY
jgi:cell division protein FtsL